MSLETQM